MIAIHHLSKISFVETDQGISVVFILGETWASVEKLRVRPGDH